MIIKVEKLENTFSNVDELLADEDPMEDVPLLKEPSTGSEQGVCPAILLLYKCTESVKTFTKREIVEEIARWPQSVKAQVEHSAPLHPKQAKLHPGISKTPHALVQFTSSPKGTLAALVISRTFEKQGLGRDSSVLKEHGPETGEKFGGYLATVQDLDTLDPSRKLVPGWKSETRDRIQERKLESPSPGKLKTSHFVPPNPLLELKSLDEIKDDSKILPVPKGKATVDVKKKEIRQQQLAGIASRAKAIEETKEEARKRRIDEVKQAARSRNVAPLQKPTTEDLKITISGRNARTIVPVHASNKDTKFTVSFTQPNIAPNLKRKLHEAMDPSHMNQLVVNSATPHGNKRGKAIAMSASGMMYPQYPPSNGAAYGNPAPLSGFQGAAANSLVVDLISQKNKANMLSLQGPMGGYYNNNQNLGSAGLLGAAQLMGKMPGSNNANNLLFTGMTNPADSLSLRSSAFPQQNLWGPEYSANLSMANDRDKKERKLEELRREQERKQLAEREQMMVFEFERRKQEQLMQKNLEELQRQQVLLQQEEHNRKLQMEFERRRQEDFARMRDQQRKEAEIRQKELALKEEKMRWEKEKQRLEAERLRFEKKQQEEKMMANAREQEKRRRAQQEQMERAQRLKREQMEKDQAQLRARQSSSQMIPRHLQSFMGNTNNTNFRCGYVVSNSRAHVASFLQLNLVGSPLHEVSVMERLVWADTAVFLYDKDSRRMHGVFIAKEVGVRIKPEAFQGNLPAQVEIATSMQAAPLEFDHLSKVLPPLIMNTIEFCNVVLKPDEVFRLLELYKTPVFYR